MCEFDWQLAGPTAEHETAGVGETSGVVPMQLPLACQSSNASVAGSACHGFATACDPTRHFVLTFPPSSICSDMKAGSLGGRHEHMKTWTSGSGDVWGVQFGVGWRNEVLCLTIVRLFVCFHLSAFTLNHFLDPKRANGSFVYILIVRREYERQTSSKSKLLQRVSSGHL